MAGRFAADVLHRAIKRGVGASSTPQVGAALAGARDLQLWTTDAPKRGARWNPATIKRCAGGVKRSRRAEPHCLDEASILANANQIVRLFAQLCSSLSFPCCWDLILPISRPIPSDFRPSAGRTPSKMTRRGASPNTTWQCCQPSLASLTQSARLYEIPPPSFS